MVFVIRSSFSLQKSISLCPLLFLTPSPYFPTACPSCPSPTTVFQSPRIIKLSFLFTVSITPSSCSYISSTSSSSYAEVGMYYVCLYDEQVIFVSFTFNMHNSVIIKLVIFYPLSPFLGQYYSNSCIAVFVSSVNNSVIITPNNSVIVATKLSFFFPFNFTHYNNIYIHSFNFYLYVFEFATYF